MGFSYRHYLGIGGAGKLILNNFESQTALHNNIFKSNYNKKPNNHKKRKRLF